MLMKEEAFVWVKAVLLWYSSTLFSKNCILGCINLQQWFGLVLLFCLYCRSVKKKRGFRYLLMVLLCHIIQLFSPFL